MLYAILKLIVRISLKVFFRKIKVSSLGSVPKKGPMIVVSNHPNTFMDPLLVAAHVKAPVYFLANSSIFATPFTRWLFKKLHMVPIQRKIDSNKTNLSNEQIFEKCYDFLEKDGTLLIFPEGWSQWGRRLRPLKTGTARIALGAEAKQDFKLGVKIITFGLNYSKPESFRSEVFIKIGKPIEVKDYKNQYEEDSFQAVQQLTEAIKTQLEDLTITTQNEAEDQLAQHIETLYKRKLSEEIKLSDQKKEQEHLITKGIVDALQHFALHDPERVKRFEKDLQRYLTDLDRLDLNDEVFSKKPKKKKGILWASVQTALYFVLGFVPFLYGLLNNYVPYIIPSQIAYKIVKLSKVEEYIAPVMMLSGVFTFSFFYILQTWLVHWFVGDFWITLAYFLSLPLSGFFALFYANYLNDTRDNWRLLGLFFKRADLVANLVSQRKALINTLEQAKKEYLKFYEVSS